MMHSSSTPSASFLADTSVLDGWMRALVSFVRSDQPDLTNRQMAILLLTYLTPAPHTVRGLAGKLNVSKPVVTRALNTLGAYGYIRRVKDESDLRNIFIERTEIGEAFLGDFVELIESSGFGMATPVAPLRPVLSN